MDGIEGMPRKEKEVEGAGQIIRLKADGRVGRTSNKRPLIDGRVQVKLEGDSSYRLFLRSKFTVIGFYD
jgi:hypothetical protein